MNKVLKHMWDYIITSLLIIFAVLCLIQLSIEGRTWSFAFVSFFILFVLNVYFLVRSLLYSPQKINSNKSTEALLPPKENSPKNGSTYDHTSTKIMHSVNSLVNVCYNASYKAGWHTNLQTGEILDRNRAEMLCLIHSEISEAMEGERKNLMDDHLPNRRMAEVELADAVIRIADYCGRWGYDLGGAIVEKLDYNANRLDHKIENRIKDGGKKF